MMIKLLIGKQVVAIVSVYASLVILSGDINRHVEKDVMVMLKFIEVLGMVPKI